MISHRVRWKRRYVSLESAWVFSFFIVQHYLPQNELYNFSIPRSGFFHLIRINGCHARRLNQKCSLYQDWLLQSILWTILVPTSPFCFAPNASLTIIQVGTSAIAMNSARSSENCEKTALACKTVEEKFQSIVEIIRALIIINWPTVLKCSQKTLGPEATS